MNQVTFFGVTSHHLHSTHWIRVCQSLSTEARVCSKECWWKLRLSCTWVARLQEAGDDPAEGIKSFQIFLGNASFNKP